MGSHRQYSSHASLGNKSPNLADFNLHLVTKDIIPIYEFLGVFRIKLQRNLHISMSKCLVHVSQLFYVMFYLITAEQKFVIN